MRGARRRGTVGLPFLEVLVKLASSPLRPLAALVLALAPLAAAGPALAAGSGPDLAPSITPPAPTLVKTTSRYTITVRNLGNKNASGASVSIALPATHTSPQVYVLGNVMGYSTGCALAGTTLTCNLGTINRNSAKAVWIDIQMQVSAAPLALTATASVAGDTTPGNDTATHTATVLYHSVTAPIDGLAVNRHCTGTTLTAWYECTLFPSAISQHDAEFHADGTITIPGEPAYGGTWSQTGPDQLSFTYTELGTPVATFEGRWGIGLAEVQGAPR